jgi:hypothetical protein
MAGTANEDDMQVVPPEQGFGHPSKTGKGGRRKPILLGDVVDGYCRDRSIGFKPESFYGKCPI